MPLLVLAQQAASASDDASGRLSLVITALVVLAVLITIATVVFWRLTRPESVEPAMRWTPAPSDGSPAPTPTATPSTTTPPSTSPPTTTVPNGVAPNGVAQHGAAPDRSAPSEGVAAVPPDARAEQPRAAG